MPKAKKTNWRRIAEESVEREKWWAAKLEQAEGLVSIFQKNTELVDGRMEALSVRFLTAQRQLEHARQIVDAMVQRYCGVKLDTQSFNIAQAGAFHARELGALDHALANIAQAVEAERAQMMKAIPDGDSQPADGDQQERA